MNEAVLRRLLEKSVQIPESGCLLWMGWTDRDGYGRIKVDGNNIATHRAVWKCHVGEIPSSVHVCHHCDVPCCINIDHLFIGTNNDNVQDKVRKKRQSTGSNYSSAKLDETKVSVIRSSTIPAKELAKIYGVHRSKIYRIRSMKSWKR